MSLLQRQICSRQAPSFDAAYLLPVPLIRMVYEANPAASHIVSRYGSPLHQCLTTPSYSPLRVLTVSRGCQAEDPGNGETILHYAVRRQLENIRLAHSY
jgi:hypothetical protein